MNKKETDFYKPIILKNVKLDGIVGETILAGQTGKIIRKHFTSSLDNDFERICNNIISLFLGPTQGDSLNRMLCLIKKDGTGYVYSQLFPLSLEGRTKIPKKAGEVCYINELLDIVGVKFNDSVFELNVEDGDKLIWLFRKNWKFGLFFDLSGQLTADGLSGELAKYYRYMWFLDIYIFLQNQHNFDKLIEDGWFPFAQLVGVHFQNLIQYYTEGKKFSFHVDNILDYFNKDKIGIMTSNWWNNRLFNEKRGIIEAGIDGYLQNNKAGYISCIKILSTEIEGIIRLSYYIGYGRNPRTDELKQYLIDKGKLKFSADDSLGFPGLFYDYLDKVLFKGFDLMTGDVPISRHSVAHGVAKEETYEKVRAFQLILVLDQIYLFLGS